MDTSNQTSGAPLSKPLSEKTSSAARWTLILSVLSGCMLGLAIPNLVSGDLFTVIAKSLLLALGGMMVSYVVNKLAVERGAPLAVANYPGAAVVSVSSILVVGIGLFSATYAGLVMKDVDQLVLDQHGKALSALITLQTSGAAEAGRAVPATSAIVTDLQQKLNCEIESSCISGFEGGGTGPVARLLQEKLGRAQALSQEIQRGERVREDAIEDLSALYETYTQTAASEPDISKKRTRLADLDLQIKQVAARLKEAVPVELLRAYAEELKGGAELPGRPDAAAKLSAIFYQQGASLARLLETVSVQGAAIPAFPPKPGVSDTFFYIAFFLPVAAIAFVVELVFPLSLWLYTYFARSWAVLQFTPLERRPANAEEDALQRLLAAPRLVDGSAAHEGSSAHRNDRIRPADRSSLTPRGRRDH